MSNSFKLLVLPGDGIGPEVMNEVVKIAKGIEEIGGVQFNIEKDDIGGAAYDPVSYTHLTLPTKA